MAGGDVALGEVLVVGDLERENRRDERLVVDLHVNQLLRNDQSVVADKCLPRGADSFLAALGQWNVGGAGMFA